MTFANIKSFYAKTAIVFLNTVLLLLLANFVCAAAIRIRRGPPPTHNPIALYGQQRVIQAYADRPPADVVAMLHETWDEVDPKSVYDEAAQFREAPFHGRFVNVDPAGFRVSRNQGPWPPNPGDFNIFVFGGSTTFGYGVSDSETLPSDIQRLAATMSSRPVRAYNFGHGSHFSTQELLLYYWLLSSGRVPDVAIFIDGVNDFAHLSGKLDNTDYLESLMAADNLGSGNGPTLRSFVSSTSFGRAALWLRRKIEPSPARAPRGAYTEADLIRVRHRWMTNKQVIESLSAMFHVRPLFVWQPSPTYHYDYQRYHMLRGLGFQPFVWAGAARDGYPLMVRARVQLEQGNDFLWLADLQQSRSENLYVDEYHYTAAFTRDIAARIAAFLQANGYLAAAAAAHN
jgi:hypothetical protein